MGLMRYMKLVRGIVQKPPKRQLCARKSPNPPENSHKPPSLPTTCCMSGCANCVWLEYADEVVDFYSRRGESGLKVDQILKEVEENVDDEMVKAFIKMEIKF